MKSNIVLFRKNTGDEVTFEDLLRRIYENSAERHDQIIATSEHVASKIQNSSDALVLMPSLIELQKVAVKNDDQLINLANIVQRSIGKPSTDGDESFKLSADDRKALMEAAKMASGIPSQSSD